MRGVREDSSRGRGGGELRAEESSHGSGTHGASLAPNSWEEIAQILRDSGADEQETGAERKRRLRKEKGEQFKEHVMNEGIDVDVDSLLKRLADWATLT